MSRYWRRSCMARLVLHCLYRAVARSARLGGGACFSSSEGEEEDEEEGNREEATQGEMPACAA